MEEQLKQAALSGRKQEQNRILMAISKIQMDMKSNPERQTTAEGVILQIKEEIKKEDLSQS